MHPEVAARFGIDQEVALFELDLGALAEHVQPLRRSQPLPRFPSVERDMAIIVDDGVPAARVKALLEGFPLVARASLFDVYAGSPVPPGQKSLAFAVSYQSPDHTLTDAEVSGERERIVARLKRELGASLRG